MPQLQHQFAFLNRRVARTFTVELHFDRLDMILCELQVIRYQGLDIDSQ